MGPLTGIGVFHVEHWIQAWTILLFSSLFVPFLAYECVRWSARVAKFRGPVGLPILGNLLQLRHKNVPEQYRVWSARYGGVYQVQLGSIPVLVVNEAGAAKAIFAQNSHATASRPEFYTFHKVISDTSATTLGTAPYNESLKRRRKTAASALNRPAVQSFLPHLDTETRAFLKETLSYGDEGKASINPIPIFLRMNLSIGLTLHWGTRMESHSELFREIVYVEDQISNFRSTTSNLQDYIPLLRLNPFSSDSTKAREMSSRRLTYMRLLDRELDVRMEKKIHEPSIRANVLLDKEARLTLKELESINMTMLAAGLDTMNSAVSWGIAKLANRSDIQDKTLQAIREFYPEDQPLCDFTDDQQCSYLVALIKEILRYYSIARLSLPRRSIQDFFYEGKLVPKGTILFLNAWACNRDPSLWDDPDVFRPERWIEHPEAPMFTFGVGSRMCVGMQLAYRELYILFLRLLNSFSIEKDGHVESDPILGVADPGALTTQPKPYRVRFVPRNLKGLKRALQDS